MRAFATAIVAGSTLALGIAGTASASPGISAIKYPGTDGSFSLFSETAVGQVSSTSRNTNGTWTGWNNIGGSAASDVVGAVSDTGTISGFYTSSTGQLVSSTRNSTGAWGGWTVIGSGITGRPAPVADPVTGRFDVFAVGVDGNGARYIQRSAQNADGTWTAWTHIGDPLPSQPLKEVPPLPDSQIAVGRSRAGVVSVFYVGANRHLYSASLFKDGTRTGFTDLGSEALTGTPSVADYSSNLFAVVAIGLDGNMNKWVQYKHQNVDGTWTPWTHIGSSLPSAPADNATLVRNANDTQSAFYVGTNGHVYSATMQSNGTWGGWADLNAPAVGFEGTPVAMSYAGSGLFTVFVRGRDHAVYSGSQSASGAWSAWAGLGAPVLNSGAEYQAAYAKVRTMSNADGAGFVANLYSPDATNVSDYARDNHNGSWRWGGGNWRVERGTEALAYVNYWRARGDADGEATALWSTTEPDDQQAVQAEAAANWPTSASYGGSNWRVDAASEVSRLTSDMDNGSAATRTSLWGGLHPDDRQALAYLNPTYRYYDGQTAGDDEPEATDSSGAPTATASSLGFCPKPFHIIAGARGGSQWHTYWVFGAQGKTPAEIAGFATYQVREYAYNFDCSNGHSQMLFALEHATTPLTKQHVLYSEYMIRNSGQVKPLVQLQQLPNGEVKRTVQSLSPPVGPGLDSLEMWPPAGTAASDVGLMSSAHLVVGPDVDSFGIVRDVYAPMVYFKFAP